MTREEQRYLRERKKPFAQACRQVGRARGWKTIAGQQYRAAGDVLYMLYLSLSPAGGGRAASAWLSCKPLALDELYWEIFHMEEQASAMPFSFRVNGAFTAPVLTLDRWRGDLPEGELEPAVEELFRAAEEKCVPFPDIPAFRSAVTGVRGQELNEILCLLLEQRYGEAMERIEKELSAGGNGGFARATDTGCVSILEDARDWCAARMEER